MNAKTTNQQPLVSIIVPAFNAESFLKDCLSSLVSQTYSNIEIILVDDGSTDSTAELVKREFPAVRYIWQKNSGACSSPRNTGASLSLGEYIVFFDADDLMEPNCIMTHVTALMDCPAAGLSLVNYQNFGTYTGENLGVTHFETCLKLKQATGISAEKKRVVANGQLARRILGSENFASACGILVKNEVLKALRGFDESLRASEDFDFVYRAAMITDIALSWNVGFRRRIHNFNMSKQTGRILREMIRSRLRLIELETDGEARQHLSTALKNIYLSAANSKSAFTRWERLNAIQNSIRFAGSLQPSHVKALSKILIGQ